MYKENCFITLTYNQENINRLEKNGKLSLDKEDFVLFMKRLRKKYGEGIRFFHCGEYGEKFSRPHHHACIFNFDFPDKEIFTVKNGVKLYRSPSLEKLWPYGYSSIGEVNWDTASYVAKYVTKKITGNQANHYYKGREPEYVTMSRRPGIGKAFLEKYMPDIYNYDRVVVNGMPCRPPRYYDSIYDINHHERLETLKKERIAKIDPEKFTKKKLAVKRECAILRFKQHQRSMETQK